jgi:hypothetical protein
MRNLCMVISVCLLRGISTPALADAQAYCELFGKDYTDGRTLDVDQWQLNFRSAFNSCWRNIPLPCRILPKVKAPTK